MQAGFEDMSGSTEDRCLSLNCDNGYHMVRGWRQHNKLTVMLHIGMSKPEKISHMQTVYLRWRNTIRRKTGELRPAEDGSNSEEHGRFSRYMNVAVRLEAAMSHQVPEIQQIPDDTMNGYLETDTLAEYRIHLDRKETFAVRLIWVC